MISEALACVLSMPPPPPRPQSDQSMAIWLDDAGLWEQFGTRTYLYRWMGPDFAVWAFDGKGWYEQMPYWPVVEPDGTPVKLSRRRRKREIDDPALVWILGHPDTIQLPETFDDTLRERIIRSHVVDEKMQQPVDDYVLAIPLTLRRALGGLTQLQWYALEAVCIVDGFRSFLEITIEKFGGNLLVLAWHLGQVYHRPKSWRAHLAAQVMTMRPADLIAWLTQRPIAPGPMNLVGRLTDIPANTQTLDHLIGILADGEKMARLRAVERLSHRLLKVIDAMPVWMVTPRIIALLGKTADFDDHELEETFATAGTTVTNPEHFQPFREYLEASVDGPQLIRRLCTELLAGDWNSDSPYMRPAERRKQPFPAPPFDGGDLLKPILTERDLELEGRRMRNCLHSYAEQIRRGHKYCYIYEGPPRIAVVLTYRTRLKRWVVAELGGQGNREIKARHTRRVKKAVADLLVPVSKT
jgi:hypothetical protein